MTGVQLHRAELLRVGAAGAHEREGTVHLAGQPFVVLSRGAGPDEVLVPGVRPAQVRETADRVGAAQVERDGRAVIGAEQPSRVRCSGLRGEIEAVHGVAPVSGQLDAIAYLGLAGPRLGELAGHPGDLDDGHTRPVGEDQRHLQQRLQFGADRAGRRALERLRAVTALQDERLAPRHRGQTFPQLVAFVGDDERRQRGQLTGDRVQPLPVGPVRLLTRGQPPPDPRSGAFRHRRHGRGSCANGAGLITISPYRPGTVPCPARPVRQSRPAAFSARYASASAGGSRPGGASTTMTPRRCSSALTRARSARARSAAAAAYTSAASPRAPTPSVARGLRRIAVNAPSRISPARWGAAGSRPAWARRPPVRRLALFPGLTLASFFGHCRLSLLLPPRGADHNGTPGSLEECRPGGSGKRCARASRGWPAGPPAAPLRARHSRTGLFMPDHVEL